MAGSEYQQGVSLAAILAKFKEFQTLILDNVSDYTDPFFFFFGFFLYHKNPSTNADVGINPERHTM